MRKLWKLPDSGLQTPFSPSPQFTQGFTGMPPHQTDARGAEPGQSPQAWPPRGQRGTPLKPLLEGAVHNLSDNDDD